MVLAARASRPDASPECGRGAARWSSGCGERRDDIRVGEVAALEQQWDVVLLGKGVRGTIATVQAGWMVAFAEAKERFAGNLGERNVIRNDLQRNIAHELVKLLPCRRI